MFQSIFLNLKSLVLSTLVTTLMMQYLASAKLYPVLLQLSHGWLTGVFGPTTLEFGQDFRPWLSVCQFVTEELGSYSFLLHIPSLMGENHHQVFACLL